MMFRLIILTALLPLCTFAAGCAYEEHDYHDDHHHGRHWERHHEHICHDGCVHHHDHRHRRPYRERYEYYGRYRW